MLSNSLVSSLSCGLVRVIKSTAAFTKLKKDAFSYKGFLLIGWGPYDNTYKKLYILYNKRVLISAIYISFMMCVKMVNVQVKVRGKSRSMV